MKLELRPHEAVPPNITYVSGRRPSDPPFLGADPGNDPNYPKSDPRAALNGAIKRWQPNTPATGDQTIITLAIENGAAVLKPVVIPQALYNAPVNLPGAYTFPVYLKGVGSGIEGWLAERGQPGAVYFLEQVGAQYTWPIGLEEWPAFLTPDEAEGLRREMQNDIGKPVALELVNKTSVFTLLYSDKDARRIFNLVIDGVTYSAGFKFRERSVNGVGAPGKWNAAVQWNPEPQDIGGTALEIPLPLDPQILKDYDPALTQGPIGTGELVLRLKNAPVDQGSGDGFNAEDRATLKAILVAVNR